MEHNEYSVYTIEYDGEHITGESIPGTGDVELTNHGYERKTITIVAPTDERIALPMMDYTLRPSYMKISTVNIEIKHKVEVKHILRFENAYRARM